MCVVQNKLSSAVFSHTETQTFLSHQLKDHLPPGFHRYYIKPIGIVSDSYSESLT